MKIKYLVVAGLTVLIFSCSQSMLGDLLRVITDPVVENPSVVSFEKEETIEINWDEDSGTDEYILYKAVDAVLPVYEIIYQGTNLSVVDTDAVGGNRYLYTLGKIRGKKLFGPSDPILGVGSMVIEDELEDNDTKETATKLVWNLNANLYYYLSYSGAELEDYDWYYVTVPPRRQANIVVTQEGLVGLNTWMNLSLEGHMPEIIANNVETPLKNYTYEEKTFYFLISPIPAEFYADPPTAGGSLINYQIFLDSVTGLVD